MQDTFGRNITYLRLSVTDRCNYRCNYCMAEEMTFLPRQQVLTLEELSRLGRIFIELGVRQLRVTGGEPLVRRDVDALFHRLGQHIGHGLDELTLTTNGALLSRYASALYEAGVRRVNVSLDTLDAQRFHQLTRLGDLNQVLEGIQTAAQTGLKIKINTVALKDVNAHEIEQLVIWCGERGYDLSLIESMPLGEIGDLRDAHFLSLDKVRERLKQRWTLTPSPYQTSGPARYQQIAETGQRIGFITPYSHNFCATCNRVRLTCTGTLFLCLGQENDLDLRQPLRDGATDAELKALILQAMRHKPEGHDFDADRLADGAQVVRFMSMTGG